MSPRNGVTSVVHRVTWMVIGVTVVMTGVTSSTRIARIIIVRGAVTAFIVFRLLPRLLICFSLSILFVFHPLILKPDLDLTL